jgi:DNA (cytosine-5)-methyltransferase 1
LKYLSVCSGIEAATVAWHPLGWQPFAFAEIEKFPSAVLAHHYPSIPNLGDMTKFKDWPDADIDVLVGGTPCQSFSVAGLRKGMADPRGNLALTYLAIADRYRPEWLLWENVPGVLSSSAGRDFGAFIGGLAELGYHASWRVLDAQYVRVDGFARAVPQRRRRVFVVGHLGDWRRAAAVLFERESLCWNTPPRRQTGERVAPTVSSRPTGGGGLGTDFDCDGGLIAFGWSNTSGPIQIATAVNACGGIGRLDFESETFVAHALRGEGFDASEDGTGRGTPIVPVVADTITANWDRSKGAKAGNQVGLLNPIIDNWRVRRLTPGECESLQGFKRGYTAIPKAADGPRYKSLGNSMAVNVMRWLGGRIAMASALSSPERNAYDR